MPVYKARLTRSPDGSWLASAVQLPLCWSRGTTRDEALAKLRDEIRYRIEYCPCSGVDDEYVRVEIEVAGGSAAEPGARPRAWPAARAAAPAPLTGAAGCPATAPRPEAETHAVPASDASSPLGWRRWDD